MSNTSSEITVDKMDKKRVVVVGGGFGGITLVQQLERSVASEVEIVLISSENQPYIASFKASVIYL